MTSLSPQAERATASSNSSASEGPDDMPSHVKSSLLGPSLQLPVRDGGLALGTWQGVYLCELRDHGGPRTLTVTLFGE